MAGLRFMSSSALLLSDLPPDIIFAVFACCDISSVVSTGQTCQYLCHLAFDRSVWLNLLDNLRPRRRSILDRTSANLENLSVEEMIGVVRRLVTGPETWNPRQLDCDPFAEVSREITLQPTIRTGGGILDCENLAKLLPSGRYVLFKNWDELECWNVADDRLIWKHTSVLQDASVLEFAAEEMYAEDSLILMICLRVMDEPRKNYVEMITLDVQTGTPNQLCIARAPDSDYDNPFRSPVISGALAVVCTGTYSGSTTHIFIDWRAGLYFILRGRADSPLHIALIQQHILLMTPSLDEEDQIHIISNQVLHSYWAPIVGVHDPGEFAVVLAEDVPKLSTFEDPDADQSFYDMHVHESPLRRGEYRLWIGTNDSRGGLFCSQLSISMDGEPQWRVRSRASETKWFYPGTSYSGHSLLHERSEGYTIYSATPSLGHPRVELLYSGDYIDVAPYSGALTYSTYSAIVIKYYK